MKFFPYLVNMPLTSTSDLVLETGTYLTHLLQNPVPALPFKNFCTDTSHALATLADRFSQLEPKTPTNPHLHIIVPSTQGIQWRNQHRIVFPEPASDDATSHPVHSRAVPTYGITPPGTRGHQHLRHISTSPPPPLLRQRLMPFPSPSPRVSTVVREDNSYTGANNRGYAGETLSTADRYPTCSSQYLINNLYTPSKNQLPEQSSYSTAANIFAVIHADTVISTVLDPSTGT